MALKNDIAVIERQEKSLWFDRFSETEAWALGAQIREWGVEQAWPIAIDVRLFHRPLFFTALAGAVPDNNEWIRKKQNVVARFHRSSYGMGLSLKQNEETLEDRYGLPSSEYAPHGGSFPLFVSGVGPIGSVTVSGLPQRDDHTVVVRAICRLQGKKESDFQFEDPLLRE